jgi:hypothetical protein
MKVPAKPTRDETLARTDSSMIDYHHPDLTVHPPRSPRVRLGGFAHLPRLLDKARAFAAGRNGAYNYDCPLDKRFWSFTGIDPKEFLAAVGTGKSDSEMLIWVMSHLRPARGPHEIAQWSAWLETNGPGSAEMHAWIGEVLEKNGPARDDVCTYFDNLDLDDFVSFGGAG